MAVFVKNLCAVLLFVCLVHEGSSCTNADLELSQAPTGVNVEGKPEFKVNLQNDCSCVFSNVILACDGFETEESIDKSILKQDGEDCIINFGNPIDPYTALSFTYVWDQAYNFTIKNAQIACS